MGDDRAALREPPVLARFERLPYDTDGFGFRIASADHAIEARWETPDAPFWVDGQNGGFTAHEDIWALMVGAPRAHLVVDGRRGPGRAVRGRRLDAQAGPAAELRPRSVRRGPGGTGQWSCHWKRSGRTSMMTCGPSEIRVSQ